MTRAFAPSPRLLMQDHRFTIVAAPFF